MFRITGCVIWSISRSFYSTPIGVARFVFRQPINFLGLDQIFRYPELFLSDTPTSYDRQNGQL